MGTISDKLMRIINTKEDIRQALISKGYDVPTSIPFKAYAKMILDLPCNADSFPDIEGIVARYSASGLTNEQMAANPVWVDKTGNGHDLQMKNFAWAGMSGVGGYKYNFLSNGWSVDVNQSSVALSHKIVIINKRTSVQLVKLVRNELENTINITLKITGLEANGSSFKIYDNVDSSHAQEYNKDGIYQINYTATEGASGIYFYAIGGNMGQLESPITIEQLPLYPGALVFDGVDDWAGCDNLPLLPKEKGYSIIALRNWITRYDATQYKRPLISNLDTNDEGAFLIEYRKDENVNDVTGSYNSFTDVYIDDNNPITWQTSSSYNGQIIKKGTSKSTNKLCICKTYFGQLSNYANAAIWEIVILDHDATEKELTKIKDYFVKTYPWLFPYQAWTVVGKTNEDEDRATIANITGNGNDLVLSNFGFAEGSGYGLYVENYSNSRWFINNSITGTKKSDTFNVTSINQVAVQIQYIAEPSQSPYTVPSYTIKVTGLTDGQTVNYRVSGGISYPITQDGIYILPGFDFAGMGSWYGFQFNKVQETCDITIEQIPEYEGYLVTDGVDDKVQSSSFTMNEDWTIVGDWELLSNVQINCGIVKAQNVYLYNTANGLLISINNPRSLQSFGTKSLHAICSDGRLYDLNWVEYEYTVDQNFEIVESSLNIGFNLNNYTQIAFKNLGIYNNQILSKDDCIKAYNYLQTLKSK